MVVTPVFGVRNGGKLPGVQDILRNHPAIELSPGFFNKDPEPCEYRSVRKARLPTPNHVNFKPESGLVPQYLGNQQPVQSEDVYMAMKSRSQHHNPPDVLQATLLPIRQSGAIFSYRPHSHLQPLALAPVEHRAELERSAYWSAASKIASNNRHKQSEKKRRDEMTAYIQAGDILRGSLQPGALCSICNQDDSEPINLCTSSALPESVAAVTIGSASKKTNSQRLEKSLMWEFSIVLHLWPDKIGKHLDDIRALAGRMRREKKLGKINNPVKSDKRDADSRAEVLMDILHKMRLACQMHNENPCACGKHDVEDWSDDSLAIPMTPPSLSSRTSPMMGQRRSREMTEEKEQENRRVRQRSNARL